MSFATPDLMRGVEPTACKQATRMTMSTHNLFAGAFDDSFSHRLALQNSVDKNKQILGVNACNRNPGVSMSMFESKHTQFPNACMPQTHSNINITPLPCTAVAHAKNCEIQHKTLNNNDMPIDAQAGKKITSARDLAEHMFQKRTQSAIDPLVHDALQDHKKNIERTATDIRQQTELMQQLHIRAQALQRQLDATKQSITSIHKTFDDQKDGIKAHAGILDTMHEGMLNHTSALNALDKQVKHSTSNNMQTVKTLAQIQDSLEDVENAMKVHANILDTHETKLQKAYTASQFSAVPDIMGMAPRRR